MAGLDELEADAPFGFVLIQETNADGSIGYRIAWVSNANDILIRNYANVSGATLVEPDPGNGGIAGPLGIVLSDPQVPPRARTAR